MFNVKHLRQISASSLWNKRFLLLKCFWLSHFHDLQTSEKKLNGCVASGTFGLLSLVSFFMLLLLHFLSLLFLFFVEI